MADTQRRMDRRRFLVESARVLGIAGAAGALSAAAMAGGQTEMVWQIDPEKCIACGNCATACVLTPSAVKAVHDADVCGYCDLCFGFFAEQRPGDEETAENQRCPVNAIERNFVEEPYYEYRIDEPTCIGCAICVEGCSQYGNGALVMQVRHDRCVNCNECAIAAQCPAQAFVRVSADDPYLLPGRLAEQEEAEEAEERGETRESTLPLPGPETSQPQPQPSEPAAQEADPLRDITGGDPR